MYYNCIVYIRYFICIYYININCIIYYMFTKNEFKHSINDLEHS